MNPLAAMAWYYMALEGIGDEECMGLSLGVFHLIGRLQRFVFFHVKITKGSDSFR